MIGRNKDREHWGSTYRRLFPGRSESWDDDAEGWDVKDTPDGLTVWVVPMMFTAAVIIGKRGDLGYLDRWCYHDIPTAYAAAEAWNGEYPATEPEGWHRHPRSGRRREHGNPAAEVIAP